MARFKAKKKDCQLIIKVKLSFGEKLNRNEWNNFSKKYIRGLFRIKKVNRNTIEYFGPLGIGLYDWLKRPVSKYDFFFVIEQIIDLISKLQKAQLILTGVVLDLKKIYINEKTKELQFIYLPLQRLSPISHWFEMLEHILYLVTPIQGQENYLSKFTYFFQGMTVFEPDKIEDYIIREEPDVVNIIKKYNVGKSGFMTDKQRDYYDYYHNKEIEEEATGLLRDEGATGLMEAGEATGLLEEEATGLLLEEEEATGLLLEEEEATGLLLEEEYVGHCATLYRVITEETIAINKPVFRLGKEKSYSDYFVNNNNAVSRSHANIIIRGQKYFIMDLNSTNRTYINGVPLVSREENEIFDGDNIRLGNEEFIFHE